MKKLLRAVPHLTIVLGLMTLTFFCIDRVNRAMAFMTSELSKWVFAGLALLSIISSVSLIAAYWREDARKARERREHQEEQAFYDKLRAAQDDPAKPAADPAPEQENAEHAESPEQKDS